MCVCVCVYVCVCVCACVQQDSGDELLEHLTETTTLPDIVLLDVTMPGKNGYEVRVLITWIGPAKAHIKSTL